MEFNSIPMRNGMVWFGLVGKREGEESVKGRVFWSEGTVTNLRLSIGLDWIDAGCDIVSVLVSVSVSCNVGKGIME